MAFRIINGLALLAGLSTAAPATTPAPVPQPNSALKDQYQTCWNVQLSDPTLFCTGLVDWPITLDTYFNPGEQDAKAKADY